MTRLSCLKLSDLLLVALVVFFLSLVATAPAEAQVFVSAPQYSASNGGWGVFPGDFNGDGKPDLAIPTSYGNIAILLNNGDGSFQRYTQFSASVSDLAVGDFDRDGKLDLAASQGGSIAIYAGRGDGTFRNAVAITATSPASLTAADLNGDGKLDLAFGISSREIQGVGVMLGNGNGTFQPEVDQIFDRSPLSIQVADFNSDGKPDVLVLSGFGQLKTSVRILLGNGDGTLQPPIDSLAHDFAYTTAVADFDGDGHLDVAVEGRLTNVAIVLFGTGDGHLRNERMFPTMIGPRAVVAADFNGDGKPDLATANYDDYSISVFTGLGNGGFAQRVDYAAGTPITLAVSDFNSDGKPDLTAVLSHVCCQPDSISVLLNRGNGSLYAGRMYDTGIRDTFSVATGDLNGDGTPDVVAGSRSVSSISVLLGNADGTLGTAHVTGLPQRATDIALGDVNNDGNLDVIAVTPNGSNPGTITIRFGNGDGTLQGPISNPVPHIPGTVFTGDLNRDGILDLVVGETAAWPHPGDLAVMIGNGDGTFQPAQTYNTGGKGESPFLTVADANSDGKLDILIAHGNTLAVLLGKGDGTFRSRIDSNAGTHLFDIVTADFNLDGNLDVLSAGGSGGAGGNVGIMFGNGDGSYGSMVKYHSVRGPHGGNAADFNHDGYPDPVVTNGYGSISTFLNNGDGTLQAHQEALVGSYPEENAVADFNGDGFPDLVVSDTGAGFSQNVTVLLNQGGGN